MFKIHSCLIKVGFCKLSSEQLPDCENYVIRGLSENYPFWKSLEPVVWPWRNMAASQRRPFCASVNSHSPVGLVSWQWDIVDRACVLCDRRIRNDRASNQRICINAPANSTALVPAFLGKHRITPVCQHPCSPDLARCTFWFFPKLKSPLKMRRLRMRRSHSTQP